MVRDIKAIHSGPKWRNNLCTKTAPQALRNGENFTQFGKCVRYYMYYKGVPLYDYAVVVATGYVRLSTYGSVMGSRLAMASPVSLRHLTLFTESSLSDQTSTRRPNKCVAWGGKGVSRRHVMCGNTHVHKSHTVCSDSAAILSKNEKKNRASEMRTRPIRSRKTEVVGG